MARSITERGRFIHVSCESTSSNLQQDHFAGIAQPLSKLCTLASVHILFPPHVNCVSIFHCSDGMQPMTDVRWKIRQIFKSCYWRSTCHVTQTWWYFHPRDDGHRMGDEHHPACRPPGVWSCLNYFLLMPLSVFV